MEAVDPYRDPEPIIPAQIPYRLTEIPEGASRDPAKTFLTDAEERFRRHPDGAAWIAEHFEEDEQLYRFRWDQHWSRIDYPLLAKVFTFDELLYLWVSAFTMTELGTHIEKQEPLLWKVQNALWQYGAERGFNAIARTMNGLRRVSIDLPGFEVKLATTYSINTHGRCWHDVGKKGLYLDGAFALLLYYRGKHVLTVGFSPSREGILVAQVQLREKKGNRFLFQLDRHYLDIALDILARAFHDQDLWLVDGSSAVKAIRRSYPPSIPCTMTSDDEVRIKALYNRPLERFRRTRRTYESNTRKYVRLVPKRNAVTSVVVDMASAHG